MRESTHQIVVQRGLQEEIAPPDIDSSFARPQQVVVISHITESRMILTLAFVGITVAMSIEKRVPLWKSNSLPSLLYSLDCGVSEDIAGSARPAANMEEYAKAYEMAVSVDNNTVRLRARPRMVA